MEHIAPLLQTLLWVLLVGGIAFRFHKPIHELLEALADRIKKGSDIKAGPFSVTGMQPLPPKDQAARANEEIAESLRASTEHEQTDTPQIESRPAPTPIPTASPQYRAKYFQAEDLALRAIEAEFGKPINRHVTAGQDKGFDGTFVLEGRLNIVEVKYVTGHSSPDFFRAALQQIESVINQYHWRSVNIVLAVVVDQTSYTEDVRRVATRLADEAQVPTAVRVYPLSELQTKFGVIDAG
ncbi:MAG TPA: hypothetical protein VLC71_09595 [Thermomonas sp.]|nr:hypothetical protein [Thermomonas sp.]